MEKQDKKAEKRRNKINNLPKVRTINFRSDDDLDGKLKDLETDTGIKTEAQIIRLAVTQLHKQYHNN